MRDAKPGIVVPPSESPFLRHDTLPPPPSQPGSADEEICAPLGIPVVIEADMPPSTFSADWIVSSASHLPVLFPEATNETPAKPMSVHAIVILPTAVAFPRPPDQVETDASSPDSNMFVFPPGALRDELGTCTALQVGSGTSSCPAGYCESQVSATQTLKLKVHFLRQSSCTSRHPSYYRRQRIKML